MGRSENKMTTSGRDVAVRGASGYRHGRKRPAVAASGSLRTRILEGLGAQHLQQGRGGRSLDDLVGDGKQTVQIQRILI